MDKAFGNGQIQVGGRSLKTTPVFETYWRFAAERQSVFMRRVAGQPHPWTTDPILAAHRFTNAYRAADRVSQYLIRHVLYRGKQTGPEIVFRTLLFKLFNRIDTWEHLRASLGELTWDSYELDRYASVLNTLVDGKAKIYSSAYIMPSPQFGHPRKHINHLRLIEYMMRDGVVARLENAKSLEQIFNALRSYPSLGDFLAFQLAIDLNYSEFLDFSEMDFVVAGPGARDGIRKCFADMAGLTEADVIRAVTENATAEFKCRGLHFRTLWGRPLQLIDCQNLFCEVDKYSRVAHPEFVGKAGRTRIKRKFKASAAPLPQWYPPKWKLNPSSNLAITDGVAGEATTTSVGALVAP